MKRPGLLVVGAAAVVALLSSCQSDTPPPPAAGPPLTTSAPSSPSPSLSTKPVSCEEQIVGRMTPAQRAGQLLMIGTDVDAPGNLGDTIGRYHLGGVFLHGRSTRAASALRDDIGGLQRSASPPILIALDQEGGQVQTLKGADFPLIPEADELGAGPLSKLRSEMTDSARRLHGIGVTMNLAPVADTVPAALGEGNPPIGGFHRQFGSDPARVAAAIDQVVAASQGEKVLTTLKHFPGLGRTRSNTDLSADASDSVTTANDPYLKPFASGIKAGSAAVMISSASYPKLDDKTIAAFSKPIITGLLRDKMGFKGLVMSDDLGAAKAAEAVEPGDRAVRFVAAGGDMTLSVRPEDAAPMAVALVKRAEKDTGFYARVTDAAEHVIHAKIKAGLLSC